MHLPRVLTFDIRSQNIELQEELFFGQLLLLTEY